MRLTVRLTGTTLRLTGSRPAGPRPGVSLLSFLVTETGEPLATDQGEQLLAEPSNGQ